MIGVSPAYFLSRSGPGFGPDAIVSGLPFLATAGYGSFQAEVFLDSALPLWTEAASRAMVDRARTERLQCSAFVAHFLGTVFSSGASLSQGLPMDQVKAVLSIASSVTNSSIANSDNSISEDRRSSRTFALPLLAFTSQKTLDSGSRFRDLLGNLITLCRNSDLQLALELVPGNILGGSTDFLSLVAEPGFADLGLLFDTGHFRAMGEQVHELPRMLGKHIVATHLCDNDGIVNLSLCPGDGTIAFPATLKALGEAGYTGSLDLEIVCPKDQVDTEYRRGIAQFRHLADWALAFPETTTHPDHHHAAGPHSINTINTLYKETI